MAGPAYVRQQASGLGAGSSFTPTLPTGITVGNLLVMACETWASADPTVGTPSGWTLAIDGTVLHGFGDHQRFYVWVKKVAVGETAPTLTRVGSGNPAWDVVILEYSGQDATTPLDGTGSSSAKSTSTSPPCPAITTTVADSLVLYFYDGDPTPTAVPASSTSRVALSTSNVGSHLYAAEKAQATAGTVAATSWSAPNSGSQGVVGATMAIKAAVSTTPVSATRALQYGIQNLVSATRVIQYGVQGRVSGTRALQYTIAGGAIATRQLLYNVFQPVGAARQLRYVVAGRIAAARSLKYTVVAAGSVAATRKLMYGITGVDELQGRFCIAFNANALEWDEAIFTRMDDPVLYPNLVTSYQIDRGRQYELDRTDTGRATVSIADVDGILNPRNPDGPYYGQLRPLLQACINRYNPTTGAWRTRYRGYIEDFTYTFDPSQRVNRLTISLVDQFEILSAIEMQPGRFGHGSGVDGQVTFGQAVVSDRIKKVLDQSGIQTHARVIFSGNVVVSTQPYSAGESPMTVIQEAADGEFPGVSNVYCDRKGRLCFHGRLSKFYPDEVAAGASIGAWDFQRWNIGDGAAVHASLSDTAQVRGFGFTRGLAKIINQATATPNGLDDNLVAGQLVEDTASTSRYGIRSWSATNLVTHSSELDLSDAKTETRRFANYYVTNYAQPRDRIEGVTLRALRADDARAVPLWKLLCEVDIADAVLVTVASPGGGGFEAESYFVEGVHETCQPLGDPNLDDVTLSLDLSPEAYFKANPWPDKNASTRDIRWTILDT